MAVSPSENNLSCSSDPFSIFVPVVSCPLNIPPSISIVHLCSPDLTSPVSTIAELSQLIIRADWISDSVYISFPSKPVGSSKSTMDKISDIATGIHML